jgi:hypothetical protein
MRTICHRIAIAISCWGSRIRSRLARANRSESGGEQLSKKVLGHSGGSVTEIYNRRYTTGGRYVTVEGDQGGAIDPTEKIWQ